MKLQTGPNMVDLGSLNYSRPMPLFSKEKLRKAHIVL